jgi:ankyrin repeat protein
LNVSTTLQLSSLTHPCAGPEKNDETPLHLAVRHAPLATVQLLVSLGASLKPHSKHGTTVLAEALLRGKDEVAEFLVRLRFLGGATSSLGDAESSLGDTLRARWVTLRARWVTR